MRQPTQHERRKEMNMDQRKPYEAPRVTEEGVLERAALACTVTEPQSGATYVGDLDFGCQVSVAKEPGGFADRDVCSNPDSDKVPIVSS